ncbi:MAG: DUF2382 domain-containing protein [Acidobacteriota bacterium]
MAENSVEKNMTKLNHKNAAVEQNKTGSAAESAAGVFQEGSFEIKTQAEIPVISKTARVVEEVVISKKMTEHAETVRDSVKRTDVRIEEIRPDDAENRKNG